jgi:thioredoxin-related protein
VRVDYASPQGQALARRYQVRAHPAVVVIDRRGTQQYAAPGIPNRARVAQAIEQVLTQER